jgi:hypothetical protein
MPWPAQRWQSPWNPQFLTSSMARGTRAAPLMAATRNGVNRLTPSWWWATFSAGLLGVRLAMVQTELLAQGDFRWSHNIQSAARQDTDLSESLPSCP